ncbi:MAG: hypothetical protein AB3N14_01655 [Flavobacteriaceae bacterium]
MQPGPDKILKNKTSGNLVRISTILSGNTFGARSWTDGKIDAPMWPDYPLFRRNPNTGETFWCEDCEEVGSSWGKNDTFSEVPHAEEALEAEYLAEIAQPNLDTTRERYLRIRLWWLWNNGQRGDENLKNPARFYFNLKKLVPLLDLKDDGLRIMAAEALREMGEHEWAAELLNYQFDEEKAPVADCIRALNQEHKTQVEEIHY